MYLDHSNRLQVTLYDCFSVISSAWCFDLDLSSMERNVSRVDHLPKVTDSWLKHQKLRIHLTSHFRHALDMLCSGRVHESVGFQLILIRSKGHSE